VFSGACAEDPRWATIIGFEAVAVWELAVCSARAVWRRDKLETPIQRVSSAIFMV
jgi:hypothetical protein